MVTNLVVCHREETFLTICLVEEDVVVIMWSRWLCDVGSGGAGAELAH